MPDDEIKAIAEKLAVPIYEDALRPFAKEISKGLVSIARIANSGVYFVEDCVLAMTNVLRMTAENLAVLPPERISFEKPRVALQALNESRYAINEEEIQRLFSNLISSSLDVDRASSTHPAYVEVIKQLQPDEAVILKFMFNQEKHRKGHAPIIDITRTDELGDRCSVTEIISDVNLICEDAGCVSPESSILYLSNLKRIGLLTSSSGTSFSKEEHEKIFTSDKVKKLFEINSHLQNVTYKSGQFSFTGFGGGFVNTCICDENYI